MQQRNYLWSRGLCPRPELKVSSSSASSSSGPICEDPGLETKSNVSGTSCGRRVPQLFIARLRWTLCPPSTHKTKPCTCSISRQSNSATQRCDLRAEGRTQGGLLKSLAIPTSYQGKPRLQSQKAAEAEDMLRQQEPCQSELAQRIPRWVFTGRLHWHRPQCNAKLSQ